MLVLCPAVILHQAVFPADGGQALVSVVLPQGQAVLAPAGHHPVGVHDALGDQIIHQGTQIAGVPGQDELFLPQGVTGGVQSCQQTLRGCFLVAGGAVELPGTVQAPDMLAFQCGFQAGGVYTVVLDGVGRAHDLNVLKALDAAVKRVLHIFRQAAGSALQIHFLGVLPTGLHKDGVALLARKPHHLILNGGTVPGADALDHTAVKGAALDVIQNDLVGGGVGVGDPALHFIVHRRVCQETERLQLAVRVAGLALQLGEINAPPVDTGRGAGLEPPQGQARRFQALGQGVGRVHSVRAGGIPRIPDKNFAAQVGARGNDNTLGPIFPVELGHHALDSPLLHLDGNDFRLMDGKAGRQLQRVLHIFVVSLAVGLDAQGVDGRALTLVQHPALQISSIRRQAHHTAKSVQFTHQRTFCSSTDAGVAGHIADGIQTHGKDCRLCPQRGGGVGCLNAGMARPDDDNIIIS